MSVVEPSLKEHSAVLELVSGAFQAQRALRRGEPRAIEVQLTAALEALCEAPSTLAGFWARLGHDDREAQLLATAGRAAAYLEGLTICDDPQLVCGQGPGGLALRTLSPVIASVDDPIFAPWRERARRYGITGSLSAAAATDDGTRYLLSVYRSDADALPSQSVFVLHALAQAAAELHNEHRRATQQRLTRHAEHLIAWIRGATTLPPETIALELADHLAALPGVGAVDLLVSTPRGDRRFERLATRGTLRSAVLGLPEPTPEVGDSIPDRAVRQENFVVVHRPAADLRLPDHWRTDPRLRSIPFVVAFPLTIEEELAVVVVFADPRCSEPRALMNHLRRIHDTTQSTIAAAAALAERIALGGLLEAIATHADDLLRCRSDDELAAMTTRSLVDSGFFDIALVMGQDGPISASHAEGASLREFCAPALDELCDEVRRSGRPASRNVARTGRRWDTVHQSKCENWLFAAPIAGGGGLVLCARATRSPMPGRRELLLLDRMAKTYKAQRERIALETSLRLERDQQRSAARHDLLTGLPNRLAFLEEAAVRCALVEERGVGFALGVLDLDGFKEWNDIYRHSEGDRILRDVGRSLATLPSALFVARLGGDEFGLLAELHDIDLAELSQRIHTSVGVPTPGGPLSGSLGWALYGVGGTDVETLLAHADEAMYHAKAQGGGRTSVFEETMARAAARRHSIRVELNRAIDERGLTFWYQPQVDLAAKRLAGVELLARWRQGQRVVGAREFMDIVERDAALARRLDLLALAHAGEVLERRPDIGTVAVNIAARHLLSNRFASDVASVLHGVDVTSVVLEITESSSLGSDLDDAIRHLHQVRSLGLRIAVDDFGTGWASLSYVHALPINQLKLDRSLLAGLARRPRSFAAALSAVALATYSGIEVVGEGIEDEADLEMWRAIGGRYVQGYLLGRPQPSVPTRLRPGSRPLLAALATFPLDDLPMLASLVAARAHQPFARPRDDRCELGAWLRRRAHHYGETDAFGALYELHEQVCGWRDESERLAMHLEDLFAWLSAQRQQPSPPNRSTKGR